MVTRNANGDPMLNIILGDNENGVFGWNNVIQRKHLSSMNVKGKKIFMMMKTQDNRQLCLCDSIKLASLHLALSATIQKLLLTYLMYNV